MNISTTPSTVPSTSQVRQLKQYLAANIDVNRADGKHKKALVYQEMLDTVIALAQPAARPTDSDGGHGRSYTEILEWGEQQAERLARVEALAEECEHFVAPYSCLDSDSGKTLDAEFEADRACLPCRLRAALDVKAPRDESGE